MTKGFFITGTDTDIGKTVATSAFLNLMRAAGSDAVPMKPVQTGCTEAAEKFMDLDLCMNLGNLSDTGIERSLMNLYEFETPCSPHLAAEKAGAKIELGRIRDACLKLMNKHDCVLVEGAGGVLVPLNKNETMLDLMVMLALPVVVVARPGLGTINHTLMTLKVLRDAGLYVSGVVFCETEEKPCGEIENNNWQTIEHFGRIPVLGRIPYLSSLVGEHPDADEFTAALAGNLVLPDQNQTS